MKPIGSPFTTEDLRVIAKALRGYRANRQHKHHYNGISQLRRLEHLFTDMADRRDKP